MAEASTEIPGSNPGDKGLVEPGVHAAYFFDFQAEKQQKLFSLCKEAVDQKNAYLFYIAGKQGVKGIRLSLKDTGFDVSAYEKRQQMKIVDSEEFFMTMTRQQSFQPIQNLNEKIIALEKESTSLRFSHLVIIAETDMLVRKGYLSSYEEFDKLMGNLVKHSPINLICAFDRRELLAKGVANPESELGPLHNIII
jgi:MEDS: MEthanogen/methylotroph, DcmR Sensory domain